jgi:hypothetical protein
MTYNKYLPKYRGTRQHQLDVVAVFTKKGHGDRNRFMALSASSSEVLFYGRIYAKDIQSTERWTSNVSPRYISLNGHMLTIRIWETVYPKNISFPRSNGDLIDGSTI